MKIKWFVVFILLALFVFTSSCKKNNPTPSDSQGSDVENPDDKKDQGEEKELTEEEKINKLIEEDKANDRYNVYYCYQDGRDFFVYHTEFCGKARYVTEPVREGYIFGGWYKEKECLNPYDFTSYVLESIVIFAKWEKYEGVDYSFLLDEYVPDIVNESFELPNKIAEYPGISLTWRTSDANTIDNYGNVYKGRKEIEVEITLIVTDKMNVSYSKTVKVQPVDFLPLSVYSNRLMFGYYSTWNFTGYQENHYKLDVINASFAYVTDKQEIDARTISSYIPRFLEARNHDTRVVLSIQGAEANSTNFSLAASTEENRKRFAVNIADFIEKYHFDGVDIDWEYPGWSNINSKHFEAERYTLMMKEIYTELKSRNEDYLVTAAIPGGPEGHQRYDLDQVAPYLDFIHLMTYDLEASTKIFHHTALYGTNGRTTGNQCSLADSVEIFTLKGVPKNKLVAGIAFYGKQAHPASATNGGLGSNSKDNASYKTITYTNLYNNYISKIDGNNITYYFDQTCQAPYLYVKNENLFITYDDEKSIKAKCNFARGSIEDEDIDRLGGVMIWEIGEDRTGNLMNAVITSMKRG